MYATISYKILKFYLSVFVDISGICKTLKYSSALCIDVLLIFIVCPLVEFYNNVIY